MDIGAHDGKSLSNTRALAELGWSGVMIEPSPFVFPALVKNCKEFPNVKLFNCAITTKKGLIKFYDTEGDFIGTTESDTTEKHFKKWGKECFKHEFYVVGVTPAELHFMIDGDPDFINIDVEGNNYELFREMVTRFSPQLWCIEFDDKAPEITNICKELGYNLLHQNGENLLLGK